MAGKRGRPKEAVPAKMAERVLDWVAHGGNLRAFCRQKGVPKWRTVYKWIEKDLDFRARFERVRELGADAIAYEALEIADTPMQGQIVKVTKNGKEITYDDMLGHRRLQVETRLKLLAKWHPKKYGENLNVNQSGEVVHKHHVEAFDVEERLMAIREGRINCIGAN